MDVSFESTSTEESHEPSYPPAIKMDFSLTEMKLKKNKKRLNFRQTLTDNEQFDSIDPIFERSEK